MAKNRANHERKRQAKLARQQSKAKAAARKDRQWAARRVQLQPYTGNRYKTAAFAEPMLHLEMAIHMADAASLRKLTDRDVAEGLRIVIDRLRHDALFPSDQSPSQVLDLSDDRLHDAVVDLVARNWAKYFADRTRPARDDLIGMVRTILNSLEIWGQQNHSSRGYLQFLTGFMHTTGVHSEVVSEDGVVEDSVDPAESDLLDLGHDWLEFNDEESRLAFCDMCDDYLRSGRGADVAAACRELLGEIPPANIVQQLSAMALTADHSLPPLSGGWLGRVAKKILGP